MRKAGKFRELCAALLQSVKTHPDSLSTNAFNMGLSSCVALNDYGLAQSLFDAMQSTKVQPDETSFTCMIKIASAHDTKKALKFLRELHDRGVTPRLRTYTNMLRSLQAAGDIENAELVFSDISKSGLTAHEAEFVQILLLYSRKTSWARVCATLDEMHKAVHRITLESAKELKQAMIEYVSRMTLEQ